MSPTRMECIVMHTLPEAIAVPSCIETDQDARFGAPDFSLRPVVFHWKAMLAQVTQTRQRKAGAPAGREPD